jgi:hypothetical protein
MFFMYFYFFGYVRERLTDVFTSDVQTREQCARWTYQRQDVAVEFQL